MSTTLFDNLRFGANAGGSRCTVLVVSLDNVLLKNVSVALLELNEELYNNKFQINITETIMDLFKYPNTEQADYVVTLVNPTRYTWQSEVDENISKLDKVYMNNRFCLMVDTSDLQSLDYSVLNNLEMLKAKYSMSVIFGETKRPTILHELSKRILRLVHNVCCNASGLPLIFEFPDLL